AAGLFDVSHMGQVRLDGEGAAAALEALVVGDIVTLKPGRMRYTLFTNEAGGILDDLMVTNAGDHLFLVVNAARKAHDIAHLRRGRGGEARGPPLPGRALRARGGPAAAAVRARLARVASIPFMTGARVAIDGIAAFVPRSGYPGGDGFDFPPPAESAEQIA